MGSFSVRSLSGLPEVRAGDDLASLIVTALGDQKLGDDDVVAIAQKVVSKAEGATVALSTVTPGERALAIAAQHGKDARAIQVVLDESSAVVRVGRGVLIVRTHHGLVCANAGVDASNSADPDELILLPADPDASAREIRRQLRALTGASPGVMITDSFGRAWRHGQCDTAIGCAGLMPLEDWRGRGDSAGRELTATWLAVADAIAAATDLSRAKDSREPVAIVSGLGRLVTREDGPGAATLVRPPEEDLFR